MQFKFLLAILLLFELAFASDTIRPVSYSYPCAMAGNHPYLVTYKTPRGGYICGNNKLKTPEKAQKYYWNDTSKTLTAVAFWFGQKMQSASPGQIRAKVYRVNPHSGGPGALLGESEVKAVTAIDTSDNLTVVTFSTPIVLPDTFFVSLDLTLLASGDSVGLLSTTHTCFSGEQLAWEKDSLGAWVPFNDGTIISSWGLDIDMAIFPVGDFGLHTAIGPIVESDINVYPNPADEELVIDTKSEIASSIHIVDLQGKPVYSQDVIQPDDKIEIEVSDLAPGVYFLELNTREGTSIERIVIAR